MAILYYSVKHRVALATNPLLLGQEPEEEVLADPVDLDELAVYFIRVFDPDVPMAKQLDRLPFINKDRFYPHGLRELSLLNHVGLTRIGAINIRVRSAKEPSQNKVYISYGLRVYGIVPLAVKFITDDVDLSQLLVRDFDTLGILLGIKFAFDCQACVGRG
ncbi:MAG: hypothetical protein AUK55_02825 [Syntrophobacteraceae bacterium CG2_30_61_12]|nr:MAG: hypothetical protein AUK55_02825 [Syntrophobacteraceae bacterium CG2_30_61_12]